MFQAHALFKKVLRTFKENERRLVAAHKWRISSIVDISFLETIIEVEFGRHRDKFFVPQLKAALFIRQGELVSVSLGSPRETLWSKAHALFKKVLRTFRENERRLVAAHKWRISSIVDISFLETIIEVEFGRHRDKFFVPQLKAALFIRQGELVSVSLGSPRQ
ncbi:hypothetical protein OESDEN_17617 [Oesophagostomum dentatum]|uniref:Uncharacterized protein n=1 Tax=Oesophagostomum dentatum TaxID=61180 RepID=A0A0B1SBN2_OESDE|nr:hypothetical protein OESDEN_17617 [Oesophagostomum dentatum]